MQNTNKEYKITKKNNIKWFFINGIFITNIFARLISLSPAGKDLNAYDDSSIESSIESQGEFLDRGLVSVMRNCEIVINDIPIDNNVIEIAILDNNEVILKSEKLDIDLINLEPIKNKITKSALFEKSSAFYNIYEAGLIHDNQLIIDDNTMSYIKNWDGKEIARYKVFNFKEFYESLNRKEKSR